ncbi:MAG: hypothetical protein IT555_17195 [Acetobacteraceae bacterium]|nr:hypothetical protein [Acetobacteraceae bacterium]
MLIPVATTLCQALAVTLSGVRATVANHIARARHLEPLLAFVYYRLTRMVLRLDRLAQRWQAGTLPKPRPSRAGQPRAARAKPPALPFAIPRGRLWLPRLVQPTAQYSGQVEVFLADPQTRALVEAAPQAGRILRPLCVALGITPPPWLRLPDRPRPPRKPRTPPPPPPTDRPLPDYVRAAVRAWKPKSRGRAWKPKNR